MRAAILSFLTTIFLPALVLASSPRTEPAPRQTQSESGVLCYRTFTPDEFGQTNASDMDDIPLVWTVTLTNTGATKANHVIVVFSGIIDNIESCAPFNRAQRMPGQPLAWDLSGATIGRGAVVTIHGVSKVPGLTVNAWKWLFDLRQATRVKGSMTFTVDKYGVEMPTAANIVEEVFEAGNEQRTATSNQWINGDGLVLGIPRTDSTGSYAWIRLKNPTHTMLTFGTRGGSGHSGMARGLATTASGGRLVGELRFLPPSRHDNKLVASLLGLKLNVIASSKGYTPNGLADLIYHDEASPYYGWQISRIIRKADTMLTYFKGCKTEDYLALESTLERINHAFSGPVDTISARTAIIFTGVYNPEASKFLGIPMEISPVSHPKPVVVETPLTFKLSQNYPNPFNPSTVIPFTLAEPSVVHLVVYNVIGQEIEVLINGGGYEAGDHQVSFQARGLSSGTYIYRLTAEPVVGGQPMTSIRKMSIIQ